MANTAGPPAGGGATGESPAPAPPPQRMHPYVDPPRYEQHLEEVHGLVIRPKVGEIVAIPEHQMWMLTVKDQYRTKKGKTLPADTGAARGAGPALLCAGGAVSLHSSGRQHQGAKPDASWPAPAGATALT